MLQKGWMPSSPSSGRQHRWAALPGLGPRGGCWLVVARRAPRPHVPRTRRSRPHAWMKQAQPDPAGLFSEGGGVINLRIEGLLTILTAVS